MTYPTWPSELPRPNRTGYNRQPADPRLARAASSGPTGYRLGYSSVPENVDLVVTLTRVQRGIFDRFVRDLGWGSLLFWMPDPTMDGWPLLAGDGTPLLTGDGAPLLIAAQWLCQFGKSMPTETISGVEYVKSFSVMVMP